MDLRKENQKEEVTVSPEEERMSVKRTRPAGTRPAEKEKEEELERENTIAKHNWEARESDGTRGVKRLMMNRMQTQGRTVRKMVMASMKVEEEEREEQRIMVWTDCIEEELEWQKEEEVRGEYECREAKFEGDLRQLEEKWRAQEEEEVEEERHEPGKEERIVKWRDCNDDEQERCEKKRFSEKRCEEKIR